MKYNPEAIEELQNGINFKNLKNIPVKDLLFFLRDVNVEKRKKKIIASYFSSHVDKKQLPSKKELSLLIHHFAGYGEIGTACLFMITMAHPVSSKVDSTDLFWKTVESRRPENKFKIERIVFKEEVLKYSQHLYEKARNNPKSFISKISFFTLLKNGLRVSFPPPKRVPVAVVTRIYPIKPFRQRFFSRKEFSPPKKAYA